MAAETVLGCVNEIDVEEVAVSMTQQFRVNGVLVQIWGNYACFRCESEQVAATCMGITMMTNMAVCHAMPLLAECHIVQRYFVSLSNMSDINPCSEMMIRH